MKKIIACSLLLAGLFISAQVFAQTESKTNQNNQVTEKHKTVKTDKKDVKNSKEIKAAPVVKSDTKAPVTTQTTKSSTAPARTTTETNTKTSVMTKSASGTATSTSTKQPMTTQPASETRPATKTDPRTGEVEESTISTGKQGEEVKSNKAPALETNTPVKTQEMQMNAPSSTKTSVTKDASGNNTKVAVPQKTKKDVNTGSQDPKKK